MKVPIISFLLSFRCYIYLHIMCLLNNFEFFFSLIFSRQLQNILNKSLVEKDLTVNIVMQCFVFAHFVAAFDNLENLA